MSHDQQGNAMQQAMTGVMDGLERAGRTAAARKLRAALGALRRAEPAAAEEAAELARAGLDQLRALGAARATTAFNDDRNDQAVPDDAAPESATDRARAAEVNSGPMSVLVRTLARGGSGEPVSEFLLVPIGEVAVERPLVGRPFVFTAQHADAAVRWFEQIGRKLAIDYEHQSYEQFNTRPDGLRPAAGWIGGMEARPDGLWATGVEWTERAAELIRAGEYRYFSPVLLWRDEGFTVLAGLGPVALTNDPAMHGVAPLAAGREAPATDEEPVTEADQATDTKEAALQMALRRAREETAVLRRQLRSQEADAFVERGLRLGRIVDSTSMDWRDEFLRDPVLAEARLSRAPQILPPGRWVQPEQSEADEHTEQARDVAAFKRAAAEGRVRGVKRGE